MARELAFRVSSVRVPFTEGCEVFFPLNLHHREHHNCVHGTRFLRHSLLVLCRLLALFSSWRLLFADSCMYVTVH